MQRGKELEYWAAERDGTKLAEACHDRITDFYDAVRSSFHWHRIARNWLYYHGLYFDENVGIDITAVKEISDDLLAASVNHFRNLLEHIYTFVVQQRLSYEVRAKQNDTRSFDQAKIGKHVIEHYRRERGLEETLKRAVRHALVFTEGFIHHPWDVYEGEQIALPSLPEEGPELEAVLQGLKEPKYEIVPQGDFNFCNPTIWDIVFDPGVREWERNNWLLVRTYENRYELAAQTDDEDIRQSVLDEEIWSEDGKETLNDIGFFASFQNQETTSDIIPVWNFYHRDTFACPDGAWLRMIGSGTALGDPEPLPFERIPVTRIVPAETLMTQLGYSPANDLQAPQELYNAEVSTTASNHAASGLNGLWVADGCDLIEDDLGDGYRRFSGGQAPPQPVVFSADSPGHERFTQQLAKDMEVVSGMNAVARGQNPGDLKSGEALKVMDAKAAQFSSPLRESFAKALENVGTFVLRTARDFMSDDEERVISIAGERNRSRVSTFKKNDLAGVDRVIVDIANPATDTISGKMFLAQEFIQRGMITTPQEFLTVYTTGQIEPLYQADEAQIDRLHEENDRLAQGEQVPINMYTDNHALDIREHAALLSTPLARGTPQLASAVLAHIIQHFQALMMPQVQWAMQALGFPSVPPPIDLPPGGDVPISGQPGGQQGMPPPAGGPGEEKPKPKIQGPGEPPQGGPGGAMGRYPPIEQKGAV